MYKFNITATHIRTDQCIREPSPTSSSITPASQRQIIHTSIINNNWYYITHKRGIQKALEE